jgi:hypothetical protein
LATKLLTALYSFEAVCEENLSFGNLSKQPGKPFLPSCERGNAGMAGQVKKVTVLRIFSRPGSTFHGIPDVLRILNPDLLKNSRVIPDPITKLHGDTEAMARPLKNSGSSQKRI